MLLNPFAVAYDSGLISRNANVFSLSKSFKEGISPNAVNAIDDVIWIERQSPLMILQKMQLAAILI